MLTLLISVLLALIPLGSYTAFNNIISLAVAGLYASYLIVTSFLLWRRIRGDMMPASDMDGPWDQTKHRSWGPWKIPEPLGTINNAFACVYLVFIWFWTFWPSKIDPAPQEMNFSCLVFGGSLLFSIVYYVFVGHREFKNPAKEDNREI